MGKGSRVLVLAALGGLGILAALLLRPSARRAAARIRTSSAPSIGLYEVLGDIFMGGYFDDIAADCAAALDGVASPLVLEVGPGPGHLAERLATVIPGLRWVALDIDAGMLDAAGRRLAGADPAAFARATLIEGDVSRMPFEDASFDLVVSSLSAHHWSDAAAGFGEIRRVLRPGATALVYDIPETWGHVESGSAGIGAAPSAFGAPRSSRFRGIGPVTLVRRMELHAPEGAA